MKGFEQHDVAWRRPADVIAGWSGPADLNPGLLNYSATPGWWDAIGKAGVTLLVTRETEHLVLAMRTVGDNPDISYMRIPHPSGLAVDRDRDVVHVASTRNPNQIFDFVPSNTANGARSGGDEAILLPTESRFYPGSLYIHDLALIGSRLHANAVGQNAIIRVDLPDAGYERVWWPRSIETDAGPLFWRNHLQLNSIAAGPTLASSYFSASAAAPSHRRPGHVNFPVDGRGVIFSGETRAVVVSGLTRPHSARLFRDQLWVDDSGYGTFGVCDRGQYEVVAQLPGWTRGLCIANGVAFVGTSRVIPRFYRYAPGLDVSSSVCGIHAIDPDSGRRIGSLTWPSGNQVFAIDWLPATSPSSFPYRKGTTSATERATFYAYTRVTDVPRSRAISPSGRP